MDENHNAIVRLASQIIVETYQAGVSAIHSEPYPEKKETADIAIEASLTGHLVVSPSLGSLISGAIPFIVPMRC